MQGYPTVKAFNGRWQDYQGERTAGAIKDFALRLLPDKVRRRARDWAVHTTSRALAVAWRLQQLACHADSHPKTTLPDLPSLPGSCKRARPRRSPSTRGQT